MPSRKTPPVVGPLVRNLTHFLPVGCATAVFGWVILTSPPWTSVLAATIPANGLAGIAIFRSGRRFGDGASTRIEAKDTGFQIENLDDAESGGALR